MSATWNCLECGADNLEFFCKNGCDVHKYKECDSLIQDLGVCNEAISVLLAFVIRCKDSCLGSEAREVLAKFQTIGGNQ